jgi:hypothetical protein
MKAPIFSALFVMALVQREVSPVIAIAVIVGVLTAARLSMVPAAQKTDSSEKDETSSWQKTN